MAFTRTVVTFDVKRTPISAEWLDTGLTLSPGQQMIVSATGTIQPWGWPPRPITPSGDPQQPTSGTTNPVYLLGQRYCMVTAHPAASCEENACHY